MVSIVMIWFVKLFHPFGTFYLHILFIQFAKKTVFISEKKQNNGTDEKGTKVKKSLSEDLFKVEKKYACPDGSNCHGRETCCATYYNYRCCPFADVRLSELIILNIDPCTWILYVIY